MKCKSISLIQVFQLVLLLMFPLHLVANTDTSNPMDSLENLLKSGSVGDSVQIEILRQLSASYASSSLPDASEKLEEALDIAEKLSSTTKIGLISRDLGSLNRKLGLYDKAIEYALQSKTIFEQERDNRQLLLTNSLLATLYRDKGYLKDALDINISNLKLIEDWPENGQKARYYFDAGNTYRALEQYSKAKTMYLKAREISLKSGFTPGVKMMELTMGQLLKATDQYDSARLMLLKVLPYYDSINSIANIALINYDLATVYSLEGGHKASIPYYRKALELYKQMGKLYFQMDINQKLFIAYNIVQDLAQAKAANKEYNMLKDSIDNQEKEALIADMKMKYETDKLAAEKELLAAKNRQNRLLFFGAALIAVLILISSIVYFKNQSKLKKAELAALQLKESQKQLALEKQYRDSELKALKAQMNPHFVFNVLNSIQEFIVLNQKEQASDYLAMFAELIRSMLHYSNEGAISLREEIDTMRKYLELEGLRIGEDLEFTFDVANGLETEDIHIPNMIIQPYVENAIKHGLFSKKGKRKLNLQFNSPEKGLIRCIIEDNGIGRKQARRIQERQDKKHRSFAMEATTGRLELFNQISTKKIGLDIEDLQSEDGGAKGTRVILTIPIVK